MSKILVVAYSYTGTSHQLAQQLCGLQGWSLGRIEDATPRRGPMGTLRCVLDSLLRRRPLIEYVGPSPARFDIVVLVAPIWMYRLAGPMRSFVSRYRTELRDVAVVSVMGNRGAPNAVAEIGRLALKSPLLSTAFTAREVDDGSGAARLRAFAQAVADARDDSRDMRPAEWSARVA